MHADLYANITLEQRKEVEAIFSDTELLDCMERGLGNSGNETDETEAVKRVDEAIEAFSQNPPEFWAMLHK